MTKKIKHVLGLSGGKDSAALAVHMNNNYPNISIEYFFTDTGYELPETYDYLNKLKTRLDRPIKYINPRNSFDYFLKKYNNFLPSQNARWCTIEMKLKSFEAWLKPFLEEGAEVITYVGIRYDERGKDRLNIASYKADRYNPVSCCVIVKALLDAKRFLSEGAKTKWNEISFHEKIQYCDCGCHGCGWGSDSYTIART